MPSTTNLDHYLQLRLSKEIVAEIDHRIATIPLLGSLNRCRFIRFAVEYALEQISTSQPDSEQQEQVGPQGPIAERSGAIQ